MTLSTQEDFDGFVAARWGDLEAVALVTTLDPAAAREVTTAALAGLRPRWGTLLEEGVPTTAARTALLERLVPPPRRARSRAADDTVATEAAAALRSVVGDPSDAVPAALLQALAAEGPLVRCAVAAEVVWDCPPAETGRLLGRGAVEETVRAARDRFAEAHRAARAADGFGPADHRLDADLEDLVHRLSAAQPRPPDAGSLVGERTRRVRRRAVVAGGGVLVAAGAATWWGLTDRSARPVAGRPAVTPSTAGPDDPAWADSGRWPARGVLATDLGVQALVARTTPGGRLLYADDVHDVRTVVARTLQADDLGAGTQLRMWAGSVGAPAEQLTEVQLGYSGIFEVEDVVAVGIPHPTAAALLVLTRPGVELAQYSLTARPTAAGLPSRTWRNVPLTEGVGSVLLDGPAGPATRLRCADYDGPLPAPSSWFAGVRADGSSLVPEVAMITGYRERDLGEQVVTSRLPAGVSVPQLGTGRVTVTLTIVRTPDGGVVRSVRLAAGGSSDGIWNGFGPFVVPTDRAQAPFATRTDDYGSARATWVLTTPPGGATVQLRSDDADDVALSKVVRVSGQAAVVQTPDVETFRVLVRDAGGRVLWDDRPVEGRFAYDLWAEADPST